MQLPMFKNVSDKHTVRLEFHGVPTRLVKPGEVVELLPIHAKLLVERKTLYMRPVEGDDVQPTEEIEEEKPNDPAPSPKLEALLIKIKECADLDELDKVTESIAKMAPKGKVKTTLQAALKKREQELDPDTKE